jgi:hypothetical protein
MMQHPCQLRFLFTCDTDTSRYTALKMGRRSETGREKRVTPEFGEYRRRKNSNPKFTALQHQRHRTTFSKASEGVHFGIDNDLQVTNEKIGQMEAAQISNNTKLTGLETTVVKVA